MGKDIKEVLEELFSKRAKIDKFEMTTELKELGLDSLDLVELIMDIEVEFSISFDNEEMVSFKTVGDVYKAIEAKLKK